MQPKTSITIKALIIDDDRMSREQLMDMLKRNASNVDVMQMCANGDEGLEAIRKYNPDLIFLDVEMPGMSGFDMLRQLPEPKFEVIFTTAFNQYAIRAIQFAALDYLLKPVKPRLLKESVEKAVDKINRKQTSLQLQHLLNQVGNAGKPVENLALPTLEGLSFVDVHDIVWCASDGRYTYVHFEKQDSVLTSRSLSEFEEMLSPSGFVRIHKSTLINLAHLKKYTRGEGGDVTMSTGKELHVGRAYKAALMEKVSRFK